MQTKLNVDIYKKLKDWVKLNTHIIKTNYGNNVHFFLALLTFGKCLACFYCDTSKFEIGCCSIFLHCYSLLHHIFKNRFGPNFVLCKIPLEASLNNV